MSKYDKPLTAREHEVSVVAGDLLMKGSPEYRIAVHCVHRGLNKSQTETLMYKLVRMTAINIDTADKVMKLFDTAAQASPDDRYREGQRLKIKIYEQKRDMEFDRMEKRARR